MEGKVGDRILVESESVGTPIREGEVLEVIEGSVGVRYRVRWAAGDRLCDLAGVEPLSVTDENTKASMNSALVIDRRTRGVSQVMCCACSQERTPLAPAAVAITHPAHMVLRLAPA